MTQAVASVGTWIGQHGGQLVYGGGRAGLMGVVADAALAAGARVLGVIPQALVDREQAHHGCHELLVVDTMHERKQLMSEHADLFLALPGGIGTFEELFEMWSWRQLGYHHKGIGLLNFNGYYDDLMAFFRHGIEAGLMSDAQMAMLSVGKDPLALLDTLLQTLPLSQRS